MIVGDLSIAAQSSQVHSGLNERRVIFKQCPSAVSAKASE